MPISEQGVFQYLLAAAQTPAHIRHYGRLDLTCETAHMCRYGRCGVCGMDPLSAALHMRTRGGSDATVEGGSEWEKIHGAVGS
jgi:hypothetical protein